MHPLDPFFSPKSVAVIGASHDPQKVGHIVFRNFFEGHFTGKVFAVNPHIEEIFGQKVYPSVLAIPEKLDLAILSIPSPLVPKALEECGKKKIPTAIIISAGFSEVGNHKLEEQIKAIAKKYKIRFLGPNCFGVVDPLTGVDTMFLPRFKLERPAAGSIAYISQSGATLSVVLDWMAMKGYKISKCVSYGNAADVDEADLIEFLSRDPQTSVICAYLEGVKEGRKFFEVSKKIAKTKPVICLKAGSTPAGVQATLSHTGSLAGQSEIYDAVFKQSGILKAEDLEQMFDFARVLSTQPRPRGKRVQIITDGGGYGVLAADAIVKNGLDLTQMKKQSLDTLKKSMPPHVILKNPMDLTGDADTPRFRLAIEAALADPGVDMLAIIPLFQVPRLTGEVVEVISEAKGRKPLVVIAGGGAYTETLKKSLESSGVPTFSYPERAIAALRALYNFSRK